MGGERSWRCRLGDKGAHCRRCIEFPAASAAVRAAAAAPAAGCDRSIAISPAMSDELEGRRREPRKPPFKLLTPLIYAPILPLIRISLKKQPVLRDRVFGVVLAAALLHGGYLVTELYDQESKS